MTYREKFLEFIKNFDEYSFEVVKKKNSDYSGSDEDPLRNFRLSAVIAGVTVEQGLLVRMADKMIRVSNLTAQKDIVGEVGEKLEDTLMDLSKYAAILAFYCREAYGEPEVVPEVFPEPIIEPPISDPKVNIKRDWWKEIFN